MGDASHGIGGWAGQGAGRAHGDPGSRGAGRRGGGAVRSRRTGRRLSGAARPRAPRGSRPMTAPLTLREAIDLPPVWLAGFAAAAWAIGRWMPTPVAGAPAVGVVLILAGLALMAAAAVQMLARRTTVIPRRDPDAMVTGGVFRISRNPIYLADATVLTGLILWWSALMALPLIPAFVMLITRRFILGEEARLRARFGSQFDQFAARTRRWL